MSDEERFLTSFCVFRLISYWIRLRVDLSQNGAINIPILRFLYFLRSRVCVLLEAMNAGCAIITTNTDGCAEVVGKYRCCD